MFVGVIFFSIASVKSYLCTYRAVFQPISIWWVKLFLTIDAAVLWIVCVLLLLNRNTQLKFSFILLCQKSLNFGFPPFAGLSCICNAGYQTITTDKASVTCQQCPTDKPVCSIYIQCAKLHVILHYTVRDAAHNHYTFSLAICCNAISTRCHLSQAVTKDGFGCIRCQGSLSDEGQCQCPQGSILGESLINCTLRTNNL